MHAPPVPGGDVRVQPERRLPGGTVGDTKITNYTSEKKFTIPPPPAKLRD